MPKRHELTDAEFLAECQRLGFKQSDWGRYFNLGIPEHRAEVCAYNLQHSNRKTLDFLIREKARLERLYQKQW